VARERETRERVGREANEEREGERGENSSRAAHRPAIVRQIDGGGREGERK